MERQSGASLIRSLSNTKIHGERADEKSNLHRNSEIYLQMDYILALFKTLCGKLESCLLLSNGLMINKIFCISLREGACKDTLV